jgi:transposase
VGKKTGNNPTDRAKQGVKRSLLTDGAGIPLGIAVHGANCHDVNLVRDTIVSVPIKRPHPTKHKPHGMCLDKGYRGEATRSLLQEFGYTIHLRTRKEEAQALKRTIGFKARRWVVERTHSWMNRFRGVLIRWSKKLDNYLALLHLTFAYITHAQMGLWG